MNTGKNERVAYVAAQQSVRLSDGFLRALHKQLVRLLTELFRLLFHDSPRDRREEFVLDVEIFVDDMIRKYSTSDMYGYSPRSPYEINQGLSHKHYDNRPLQRPADFDDDHDHGMKY